MTLVEAAPPAHQQVGERALRRDGPRLLTGQARYLADQDAPGLHHVAILRSPVAHARVVGIDTSRAGSLPGVVAVVIGADLEAAGARRFSHLLPAPVKPLTWPVLAIDRVRHVGEPLAAVVATSRAVAEDAIDAITVDYEELPAVVDVEAALQPGAPLLYPEWGTNELLHMEHASPELEQALAATPHRLHARFENHRVCGLPLEGHGAQASWEPGPGRLTVLASNQQPHQLRTVIAEICGLPETHVRVVSPDMGGGFGNKQHFTREECLVALLARLTGRTVRWVQDRTEALTASIHSRAQVHEVDAGYDDRGRIVALQVRVLSDLGNPVLYFSGIGPAIVSVTSLCGAYAIPHVGWELSCVATTTCPVGAYRGFGQPEAHLTTELVMDRIAANLELDPVEVRRRNLLPDLPRPVVSDSGLRIDAGPLGQQLDMLVEAFDYGSWLRRQASARAEGRFIGLGFSTLVQGTAPTQNDTAGRFASVEMASMTVLPDGHVQVRVGTKSQGQAHETVFAQLVAGVLGIPEELVDVRDGDTDALAYGQGTWGSRSAVMGGGAILQAAAELRGRVRSLAAALGHELPVEGPVDRQVFKEVAAAAWWHLHRLPAGTAPGLSVSAVYSPGFTGPQPGGTYNHDETCSSHATAVAVEVDPATGGVQVLSALIVSDCGVVINPAVVEGQHQGGFAQGLGAVLLEELRYDEAGQPLCSTLMDYRIPTAADVPALAVIHRPTPSETLGGFRGVGESAIIGSPAALAGAIEDALRPLGVSITSTRMNAAAIRAAVRQAGWEADPARWAYAPDPLRRL